jgi:hypothetical protein
VPSREKFVGIWALGSGGEVAERRVDSVKGHRSPPSKLAHHACRRARTDHQPREVMSAVIEGVRMPQTPPPPRNLSARLAHLVI